MIPLRLEYPEWGVDSFVSSIDGVQYSLHLSGYQGFRVLVVPLLALRLVPRSVSPL